MASNLNNEDDKIVKPSDETTSEKDTLEPSQKTNTDEEIDYKQKFSESTRENQRIMADIKKKEEELAAVEDVMSVLYQNPTLLKSVQDEYARKSGTTEITEETTTGIVADKVLDHKVRETVKPISAEVAELRNQQVADAVSDFNEKHPDAVEGSETWKQMLEWLPAMRAKGLPLKAGLEKAYEIATIDRAKQTGKFEAVKGLFDKQQASAGSGSSKGKSSSRSEVELSAAELKVAKALGITPEEYAKNK